MSTMPVPEDAPREHLHEQDDDLVRVYVWDRVVRSTHWIIALSIVVLSITGIYIAWPFIGVPEGAADAHVMGWMRTVHFYASIPFALAFLARVFWLFTGPRWARWDQFIPTTKQRLRDMWKTLMFYSFIKRHAPPAVGHNPMAGAAYAGVFVLYALIILTGLGLYGMSAHVDSPMGAFASLNAWFGGAQMARWIHHVIMWLLLAFAVQHVYSSILMAITERNGPMDSIFSGFKWFPKGSIDDEERR